MRRTSDEFWSSSLSFVLEMIKRWTDELREKAGIGSEGTVPEEIKQISSMKEVPGWL